jgi:hypothetical protein
LSYPINIGDKVLAIDKHVIIEEAGEHGILSLQVVNLSAPRTQIEISCSIVLVYSSVFYNLIVFLLEFIIKSFRGKITRGMLHNSDADGGC